MIQNYTKGLMIGLAVTFMILPCIFIGLRLWAKFLSAKRVGWDDYLAIAALIMSITCCVLQLVTALHGYLGQHQPQNPDGTPIMDDPGLSVFEHTKFTLNLLGILGLGLIKSSILIYYKNIFTIRSFRYAVYGMLFLVFTWTASYFFAHLFMCTPVTVFIEPYYGNDCIKETPVFLSVAISGTILDFFVLMMPVPMVLNLHLPLKQRLGVLGILMLGAAVVAVSIARVIALFEVAGEYLRHPNDVIYYTAPIFFWVNIELSLAVVSACLPTLRPIYTHFRPKQPTSSKYGYSGDGSGLSAGHAVQRNSKYGRFSRDPYSDELELTNDMESALPAEQRIVREVRISQTSDSV
ncbi:hypothetical protein K491DRAFT_513989 [Lophiostoma macrostomum CBS 122681]|uniref:Rhodopsin domain-containing protein n=1 Tax=Lophiostoma macrostomum CBS 122681 TaxID=1314788 RepID=A0A6A6T3L9_9PLEO|nr:hypothetical protein K491DRAFT_513989 [Lophiostoma macrostomum CBS 122681]